MGKNGPCFHCGVTSTPLWRNGPPEKPVLCNACGSRWRTKGTLANYTPHHAQTEFMDMEANKVYKAKPVPSKKETKSLKRKNYDVDFEINDINQYSNNVFEEEGSNRTTASSAISYTNNYGHSDTACGSEFTGLHDFGRAQSAIRESLVPSRKRTCVSDPTESSVEKLRKELKSILNQQQQSCSISMSSQEDVLVESGTIMDPFDIGHGGFLLNYTNFNFEEREESDASSITAHKKSQSASDAYSATSCNSKQSTVSSVRVEKDL